MELLAWIVSFVGGDVIVVRGEVECFVKEGLADGGVEVFIVYIYIYICFFPLKKSEQPEIVAFNRVVVNYIHFLFYWCGDQRTSVDSCNTGQKNIE